LTAKVDHIVDHSKEVTERVRKLEKWVAGAAAVVAVGGAVIGFAIAADASERSLLIDAWMDQSREYMIDRTFTSPDVSVTDAIGGMPLQDSGENMFVRDDDGLRIRSTILLD
jgi:hypothetical protein